MSSDLFAFALSAMSLSINNPGQKLKVPQCAQPHKLHFKSVTNVRLPDMQANYMLSEDPLSLDRIRSILTRLEDTIIFSLIERAQFAHNPKIYERGAFKELKDLGFNGSWLEWFLKEIEIFHGLSQRCSSDDPIHSDFSVL